MNLIFIINETTVAEINVPDELVAKLENGPYEDLLLYVRGLNERGDLIDFGIDPDVPITTVEILPPEIERIMYLRKRKSPDDEANLEESLKLVRRFSLATYFVHFLMRGEEIAAIIESHHSTLNESTPPIPSPPVAAPPVRPQSSLVPSPENPFPCSAHDTLDNITYLEHIKYSSTHIVAGQLTLKQIVRQLSIHRLFRIHQLIVMMTESTERKEKICGG